MAWVVSVKGVLMRDGRVLLALNDRDEWELPGGQLEHGETPVEAVVRELAEETAIDVRADTLLLAEPFEPVPGAHVLIVAYRCRATGPLVTAVSEEHRELRWFDVDALDAVALPSVYRHAVRAAVTGRGAPAR